MNEINEDLFEQFYKPTYNEIKILIINLTDVELSEKIQKLEETALRAKAALRAAKDTQRERRAKLTVSQQDWLETNRTPTQSDSDAVTAVNRRRQRMSEADKIRLRLEKAGIPEDTIKQMMRNIEASVTDKQMKAIEADTRKLDKPAAVDKQNPAMDKDTKAEWQKSISAEPFDPTKLFG